MATCLEIPPHAYDTLLLQLQMFSVTDILYFYFRPLVYEEEETLTCSEGSDETKKEGTP